MQLRNGKPVMFVADPQTAPDTKTYSYAKPDDISDSGKTWRSQLLDYNLDRENNSFNLLPAWQLYANPTYECLVRKFGNQKIFILSAGWGLLAADFLTPVYDITFSASAEAFKRRRKKDVYQDLNLLPADLAEPVIFLGGKDYTPLFCHLTENIKSKRTIVYNSITPPDASDCSLVRFETTTRTNWHYGCANAIIEGSFIV